jgi:hypothetical protein
MNTAKILRGAAGLLPLLWGLAAAEPMWEGPKHRGVPREEMFEFTKKPTFRNVGKDRYEIAFTSKGKCDVTVAIEDDKGKVIRSVVAGVLGANAPEPLRKNSLEQRLIWDGKNESGKYVEQPERCRARVCLGLSAKLDKIIGWHPKDVTGKVTGIGADKDGVYVLSAPRQIKVFGHDARYLRTIFPWPADSFAEGRVLGEETGAPPGGNLAPRVSGYHNISWPDGFCSLPVVKGRMIVLTPGWRAIKRVIRIGTDGTSRMQSIQGPVVSRFPSHIYGPCEAALSPDGRWIYLTGLGTRRSAVLASEPGFNFQNAGGYIAPKSGARCRNAVYRLAWNADGPIAQPFIGEENHPKHARKDDNRHLSLPSGIACDSKGRIYVSDFGNNRIQVFSAEGKHLKTIPCKEPCQLMVHHGTGEIYVHSYPNPSRNKVLATRVVKFGPFDRPVEKNAWPVPQRSPTPQRGGRPKRPLFCLDSWTSPPRMWFTNDGVVQVYEEQGTKLKLIDDFDSAVEKAGYNPHMLSVNYMNKVIPTPGGGPLYYELGKGYPVLRVDPEEGRKIVPVRFEWGGGTFNCDEVHAATDGFFYLRGIAWVGRFRHPTERSRDRRGEGLEGVLLTAKDEIPFDYGERLELGGGIALRGVIRVPSVPGGNHFNMGFGVAPNGDILALCKAHAKRPSRQDLKLNETGWAQYLKFLEQFSEFRPKTLPGVISGGQHVFSYTTRGELKGEDIIPGLAGASCGIRGDKQGNIYVGVGFKPLDEKGTPPSFAGTGVGALAKFPPTGGKLYGMAGSIKLGELPKRPGEFVHGYYRPSDKAATRNLIWSRNMLWSHGGFGIVCIASSGRCVCPNGRFDVDVYGRSFVPEHWRHQTAVLDGNGNIITHVAAYGNADSGRGPESPVKVEGGIAVGFCCAVGVDHDRYLYMCDIGNSRIVRVKLAYEKQEEVSLEAR